MKPLLSLFFIALFSLNSVNTLASEKENSAEKTAAQKAEEERCKVPAFAKAIGHEELWKKHNGCPTSEDKQHD